MVDPSTELTLLEALSFLRTLNIDLLSTGFTVAAIGILGFIIFQEDHQSITNRTFFKLALASSLWGIVNYLSYKLPLSEDAALWFLRCVLFLAVWFCFYLFKLMYVFPAAHKNLPIWFRFKLFPLVTLISLLTLSPFVFAGITGISEAGVPHAIVKPGIALFGMLVVSLIVGSFILLRKKIHTSKPEERKQYTPILLGTIMTFSLLIAFNFILPVVFNKLEFIPFGSFYIAPFIIFTAYAIYRHGLFNIKVATTATLIFLLSVVVLVEVIFAKETLLIVYKASEFALVLFIGVLLIRSVQKEVRSREKIQELASKLSVTNDELAQSNEKLRILDQRKSEFVSIASHQLRTPITAIKGYASMLLEDSFGKLSDEQKSPIEKIFVSSERLAEMIADFLNVSKIEQGTMSYTFSSVDLGAMIADLRDEFTKKAEAKGLALTFDPSPGGPFIVSVDEGKIRQCFSNLIDNSIKYTPKGEVRLMIEHNAAHNTILTRIKDTGIGLSQEDIHHLFGKFTRGSEGQRQNTEGSGLGLYVAKQMIEAMHGKIWVDSEGPGKGSTFVIELPIEAKS